MTYYNDFSQAHFIVAAPGHLVPNAWSSVFDSGDFFLVLWRQVTFVQLTFSSKKFYCLLL